jgi:signal peptidase II
VSTETEAGLDPPQTGVNKLALLGAISGGVVLLDLVTKAWITSNFVMYSRHPVIGDYFRLTYTHNAGAAFGINVGEHSRIFFLVLSLLALVVLAALFRSTRATDRVRLLAVALVIGGAIGNIIDRLRYSRGVVDFLDFGIGNARFPIFNVADMAVSTGAVLLLISFYFEERSARGDGELEADAESA